MKSELMPTLSTRATRSISEAKNVSPTGHIHALSDTSAATNIKVCHHEEEAVIYKRIENEYGLKPGTKVDPARVDLGQCPVGSSVSHLTHIEANIYW